MRSLVSITIAMTFVALALAGASATAEQTGALTGDAIDPGAPGIYTGPSEAAIPDGWFAWGAGNDDVHKQCGDLKLVFRNPDLQEDENGVVHASNRFFIQFQAVGADADEVVRFAFSFGKTHDQLNNNEHLNCNSAIVDSPAGKGTGGAYLAYYRSDYDPRDGFFVPILTTNVPDGDYAAAVHAYDSSGNEVARAWAKAVVENCVNTGSASGTCTPGNAIENDKVQPWPMVLPGDGEQTNDVDGITVEFGEGIKNETVQISLNGVPLEHEWWEVPDRDSDLQPMNDESNEEHPFSECSVSARNFCTRMKYGFGYMVDGVTAEVGDVIRVSALDFNDNLVVKTIHYGKDNSGGGVTSTCAEVQFELLDADNVELPPSALHDFRMRLANVGTDDAHVNLITRYNESKGFTASYTGVQEDHGHKDLVHSQIDPGAQNLFNLTVETLDDAMEGTHEVEAVLDYNCAGVPREQAIKLFVSIKEGATGGRSTIIDTGEMENETDDEPVVQDVEEDTPGPGVALMMLLSAAGLLAVARARRLR